jgi:hypothetical protein
MITSWSHGNQQSNSVFVENVHKMACIIRTIITVKIITDNKILIFVICFFYLLFVRTWYTCGSVLILQLHIRLLIEQAKKIITDLNCYIWSIKPFSENFFISHPVYSVKSWYHGIPLGLQRVTVYWSNGCLWKPQLRMGLIALFPLNLHWLLHWLL